MHLTLIDRTRAFLVSLPSPALAPFLAEWPDTEVQREVARSSLPVLRWLPQANTAAPAATDAVVASLHDAAPQMTWRQTYATTVDPTFLDNYGWTELVGLAGPLPSERIACGFILLGPATTYPPHRHEAEEIYIPLVGTALWQQGDGPWHERTPGYVIHHARHEPHAMQTGKTPLVALYLWRSTDLNQKAQFDPPR
jgi:quercetin dioxygenase-like cupin family protein